MAERVPARLSTAEGRKFGLTLGVAFLALSALLWWRHPGALSTIAASLGGLFVVAGMVVPRRLGPIERAWMSMAHAISKVTTPVFMGIVYYLVVLPIGVTMRALGRNPLVHAHSGNDTYWIVRSADDKQKSDLKHQF